MDITQWYAVALGCVAALPAVVRFVSPVAFVPGYKLHLIRKHLIYPNVVKISGGITRLELIIISAFLVGNALCLAINVKNIPEFTKRAGTLSIINLMPLFLGTHMNAIINFSSLNLLTYTRAHRWLGRAALCEGLVHVATAFSQHGLNLRTTKGVAALTASITFLVLFSLGLLRRYLHEVVSNLHVILSTFSIGAIYVHVYARKILEPPVVYLITAISIQIGILLLRSSQILYRNVQFSKPLNRASIRAITFKNRYENDIPVLDAVHVHVRLTRPWQPHGGQYAFLCIPGLSHTSIAQLHPFYVAWSYRDEKNDDYVVFLVQRHRGFTKDLLLHVGKDELKAIVEGPYGRELALDMYGTVLLFATGIGITGQLPYVTELLDRYQKCDVKTRRIALFWEVQAESHTAWVAEMMQELLEKDTGKILDIHLFVLGDFISSETRRGSYFQLGERIDLTYDAMDIDNLLGSKLGARQGRTVVSLCTSRERANQIREIVCGMMDDTVDLKELEFHPNPIRKKLRRSNFVGHDSIIGSA